MELTLLQRFVQAYPDLRERLRRRLGSADLADDAMNEAYVKIRALKETRPIANIRAYLFRVVLNVSVDQQRSNARLASASELDAVMEMADPAPDALQIVEGRRALAVLQEAVAALPERRRTILKAVRLDGLSCREVARELGLSTRTVETELRKALDHCAEHVARGRRVDFAIGPDQTSYH